MIIGYRLLAVGIISSTVGVTGIILFMNYLSSDVVWWKFFIALPLAFLAGGGAACIFSHFMAKVTGHWVRTKGDSDATSI
jgi:hypothetical protein